MIMIMNVLMPDESQLLIGGVGIEGESIVLSVSSTSPIGLCPL